MTKIEGTKIYENVGNGEELIDEEIYNKQFVDCARNVYHAFLPTVVFVLILVTIWFMLDVFHPWAMTTACNMYPHMNTVLCDRWIK